MKTHAERVAIARAHAEAEARNDLATTLATLEAEPVYELQPVGRVLRGKDAARRYYDHFFAHFRPLVRARSRASERRASEARGERSERRNEFGERVWASECLLRLMLGPAWDLTEPL